MEVGSVTLPRGSRLLRWCESSGPPFFPYRGVLGSSPALPPPGAGLAPSGMASVHPPSPHHYNNPGSRARGGALFRSSDSSSAGRRRRPTGIECTPVRWSCGGRYTPDRWPPVPSDTNTGPREWASADWRRHDLRVLDWRISTGARWKTAPSIGVVAGSCCAGGDGSICNVWRSSSVASAVVKYVRRSDHRCSRKCCSIVLLLCLLLHAAVLELLVLVFFFIGTMLMMLLMLFLFLALMWIPPFLVGGSMVWVRFLFFVDGFVLAVIIWIGLECIGLDWI